MFVEIEDSFDPLRILHYLKILERNNVKFEPKHVFNILKASNHPTSIRDALVRIKSGEEKEYKEVVLAMVERREHTDDNLEKMREIAKRGGFESEFEEAHAKIKYQKKGFNPANILHIKSSDEMKKLIDKGELAKCDVLITDFSGKVNIICNELPKICNFSSCDDVYICGYDNNMNECVLDLKDHVIDIKNGANVEFKSVIPPNDFDFSKCSKAYVDWGVLSTCNLNHENLTVVMSNHALEMAGDTVKDKVIDLSKCKECRLNLEFWPHNKDIRTKIISGKKAHIKINDTRENMVEFDCSNTDDLHIVIMNMGGYDIKFKEGGTVKYYGRLAKDMDFSMIDKLVFCGYSSVRGEKVTYPKKVEFCTIYDEDGYDSVVDANLSDVDEVVFNNCQPNSTTVFKEGAKVCINTLRLNETMDLSKCGEIKFDNVRVVNSDIKLILRDKQQRIELYKNNIESKEVLDKLNVFYQNDSIRNFMKKLGFDR